MYMLKKRIPRKQTTKDISDRAKQRLLLFQSVHQQDTSQEPAAQGLERVPRHPERDFEMLGQTPTPCTDLYYHKLVQSVSKCYTKGIRMLLGK